MSHLCKTEAINPNTKDKYGRTPLIEACVHGHIECVKFLLDACSNVNLANKYQNTALHAASLNNHGEIVELLLKHKSDITKKNYESKTCLNMAEDMGHAKLTDVLDYHMKREIMWRNRNCLLKIALNRDKTSAFKNIHMDLFREIIKYA